MSKAFAIFCVCAAVISGTTALGDGRSIAEGSSCNASVTTPWVTGPSPRLLIRTSTVGATCANAKATFLVRDASGKIMHRASYPTTSLAMTSDATTRMQMQAALTNWAGAGRVRSIHATLPNWIAGASAPEAAEIDFTPAPGLTRAAYMAVKLNRTPLLCYVQNHETLNCLVLRGGALEPFGVQSLP